MRLKKILRRVEDHLQSGADIFVLCEWASCAETDGFKYKLAMERTPPESYQEPVVLSALRDGIQRLLMVCQGICVQDDASDPVICFDSAYKRRHEAAFQFNELERMHVIKFLRRADTSSRWKTNHGNTTPHSPNDAR